MSGAETELRGDGANHAGLMDGMYRYQRYIYDLTRKYYLLGRDSTIRQLGVPFGGSLLEVGCGTGRNLLLASRSYPTARLYGLDISQEMLLSAKSNFHGIEPAPVFQLGDATEFSPETFGVPGFDRIMISYALSMIPNWQLAVDCALDALAPGGELHIVDFGQQEGLPRWFRRLLQSWLGQFHVTPRADLKAVLATAAKRCGGRLSVEDIGRGYAWRAVIVTDR